MEVDEVDIDKKVSENKQKFQGTKDDEHSYMKQNMTNDPNPLQNIIMENNGVTIPSSDITKEDTKLQEIINHLINTKAHFKSQQRGEPELSDDEKHRIATEIFIRSPTLFLSRFGFFLQKEDLEYFTNLDNQSYEITHYITKLKRYHDKTRRQVDVKNRRYEALKSLIEEGEYFSETEMMKRNPLLYEQLIGQYLTEEEKRARDFENVQNKSLSDMLLECFDRKVMKDLQDHQQDIECCVNQEEKDSDEDDNVDSNSNCGKKYDRENEVAKREPLWGEKCTDNADTEPVDSIPLRYTQLSHEELNVLRQEFLSNMYQSFLNGKDEDFDYSTVDDNETYDNINERSQDEEDKYFDSEEPDDIVAKEETEHNDSEDELEIYMRTLKEPQETCLSLEDFAIK